MNDKDYEQKICIMDRLQGAHQEQAVPRSPHQYSSLEQDHHVVAKRAPNKFPIQIARFGMSYGLFSCEFDPGNEPQKKTNEPQKKTNEPRKKTNGPQKKTNEPQKKTNEPQKKTNEPQKKTNEPQKKTNGPQKKTNEPQKKTNQPQKKTNQPQKKTNQPQKKTNEPQKETTEPRKRENYQFAERKTHLWFLKQKVAIPT
ncbi:hypothetical protein M8J76_013699 [Diaphorina citri]|nr:hypothetical protein M8J76_013699 [Diaphorina citri]